MRMYSTGHDKRHGICARHKDLTEDSSGLLSRWIGTSTSSRIKKEKSARAI